ncbi:unannotated protein [freshwater metagenome]|uniref:Unannotated protein n=1 Tax=freshwater metagenome TaxID=449393 RepID=A0A6J6VML1_9ZZZZ|nr:30S ribosome-binding factor RbfA [Actinomycetota bacterium]MUH58572.1 30S ribosome-binding factor RbfA [Actinomycetota bacterium]
MSSKSADKHPYPRSARVNEILREVISDVIVRLEDLDDRLGLLTVTGVETTPDLRHATVFFDSLTPEAKAGLEDRRVQIQGQVNAQTKMKRTPKLDFRIDPAVRSGESVEEIIRRLHAEDEQN